MYSMCTHTPYILCNSQYDGVIQHHQLLSTLVVNELVFMDGYIALHSRITLGVPDVEEALRT